MPAHVTQERTVQQLHVPFLPISSSLLSSTFFSLLFSPFSSSLALSNSLFLSFFALHSSDSTHLISCSLSSLRQTMTPIANFLPLRGGCWSSGLRTFRYSSEAFSRLVERDRWILKEERSKGGRKMYEYRCRKITNLHLLTYNVHISYMYTCTRYLMTTYCLLFLSPSLTSLPSSFSLFPTTSFLLLSLSLLPSLPSLPFSSHLPL